MLQEAGLSGGLAGALARQEDSRAFTAAARALFPVRARPRVPDTTVPWPAPPSEGPRHLRTAKSYALRLVCQPCNASAC